MSSSFTPIPRSGKTWSPPWLLNNTGLRKHHPEVAAARHRCHTSAPTGQIREHAKSRGAQIYAEVLGYGLRSDAYHIVQPAEKGDGAAEAMRIGLKDARLDPNEMQYINAHGTSTPWRHSPSTSL